MRLIDADAIDVFRCPQSIAETREWIDEEPTVEAIPVEWLQKFFLMRGGDLAFSVMMKEWDYYYGLHKRDR